MKSELMIDLQKRGFIHNCSDLDKLDEMISSENVAVYCGYDCTASSLHVGSLMSLLLLKKFQDAGHQVIALIGTATTMVGDPSGKDAQRPLLNIDEIMFNAAGIEKNIKQIIPDAKIVYNHEWLNGNFLDVLRDIAPFINVNHLMTLDSVKNRLDREQPMSLLELMYSSLQAKDFHYLSQQYPNLIQIGGSDQWGNIVMGLDLIRRKGGTGNVVGLTHPLLLTSDGKKMGKTESGAVWLDESKVSHYQFFQYWRNVRDDDLLNLLLKADVITTDNMSIDDVLTWHTKNDAHTLNKYKIGLATILTHLVRGDEASQEALDATMKLFSGNRESLHSLPTFSITPKRLSEGVKVAEVLHTLGFCSSISDARRTIKARGIKINDQIVEDEVAVFDISQFNDGEDSVFKYLILSKGKKTHAMVKYVD